MKQLKAKILENKRIADGFYRMKLGSSYLAKESRPGQFVKVRCSEDLDPLLRRPLGVHRIFAGGIELLYEVVGKGTRILSKRKKDEELDIIGPLGHGFDITAKPGINILIAGGIGVAPLLALAQKAGKNKKLYALLGAKTKSQVLCKDDFKKLGAEIMISTDDGSEGKCGFVTECLPSLLSTINYKLSTIYACGPNAMLKEVSRIANSRKIACQVSLEEHMACGVGVCLGCPVNTRAGYKMVCKDGPVFDAKEVLW